MLCHCKLSRLHQLYPNMKRHRSAQNSTVMNLTCLLPLAWCQQRYSNLCNTRICPFLLIKAFDQNQWHGKRQPYLIWAGESGLSLQHHKKKGCIYIRVLVYSFLSGFTKITGRSLSFTVKTGVKPHRGPAFSLALPSFLSSPLKKQHLEIFQIISPFPACDSLVVWSCSNSLHSIHPQVRKEELSFWCNMMKAPTAEHHCHVARPASPLKHQSLTHTSGLEHVEPVNELPKAVTLLRMHLKKQMHKFTHLETWPVQELVTMTIQKMLLQIRLMKLIDFLSSNVWISSFSPNRTPGSCWVVSIPRTTAKCFSSEGSSMINVFSNLHL